MTRTMRLDLLLDCFIRSTSAFLRSDLKLFFSVFSPVHSSSADNQRPLSHLSSEQSLDQGSAANQPNKPQHSLTSPAGLPQPNPALVSKQEEGISATSAPQHSEAHKQSMKGQRDDIVTKTGHNLEIETNEDELVQSSVVPWPLPLSTSTTTKFSDSKLTILSNDAQNKTQDETKMVKIATVSTTGLEIRDDEDTSHELNRLAKDQQLQEEEKLLLVKIRAMTGDTSPVSSLRSMKRLIPAPGDIDSDTSEPTCQSEIPVDLVDHSPHSIIPISLAEAEKPLNNELGQIKAEEDV